MHWHHAVWLFVALVVVGPVLALTVGDAAPGRDWRMASQASVGLAPDPDLDAEPVVQVYAARTVGWRGAFAVHTWLAVKPQGAQRYTRYEVIGWRFYRGGSAMSVSDRSGARWRMVRRAAATAARLARRRRGRRDRAAAGRLRAYPYGGEYRAWPGPNSNTFIAWLGARHSRVAAGHAVERDRQGLCPARPAGRLVAEPHRHPAVAVRTGGRDRRASTRVSSSTCSVL